MSAPGAASPIASVVVPVYNAERWLPESIPDLLGQTLRDAEFVFVDDGSTDGSLRLLEEAAARDPRVRILKQDRKFAGCARNLGMDAARGKWFIALDADDRFEPDLLEEAVRRGEETEAQIVLFDADELVMPDGKRIRRPALARAAVLPADPFGPSEETFEAFRVMATWNKLYRTDYLRETGFRYQETFECNDIRFVFLSIAAATRVAALPKVLLHYRVGLSENIQSLKDEHPFDVVSAYASLRRELENAGLWRRFRRVYATRAAMSLTGGRIAGFRSGRTARDWFERLRASDLAELGLADLADDDFIGTDAEKLRFRLRGFLSLPFEEWSWEELRRYRQSNDRLVRSNSETRDSIRETKKRLAGTKEKLARTGEKLAETKAKLAAAKAKLAAAKAKNERLGRMAEELRRSFPYRLGIALTRPLGALRRIASRFRIW